MQPLSTKPCVHTSIPAFCRVVGRDRKFSDHSLSALVCKLCTCEQLGLVSIVYPPKVCGVDKLDAGDDEGGCRVHASENEGDDEGDVDGEWSQGMRMSVGYVRIETGD